jgi:hypothetical protein
MLRAAARVHARAMKTSNWIILGALAGMAGIAINKQLRLARNRLAEQPEAARQPEMGEGRASIDDLPEGVPTVQAAGNGRGADLDEGVAPGAPF